MVQNTPGVHSVKILIGEIKLLCVTDSQLRQQPKRRQPPLRVLNGTHIWSNQYRKDQLRTGRSVDGLHPGPRQFLEPA